MKKINAKTKRKLRNRKKLKEVSTNRFRISVSKSLNNLSAQIIDDKLKKTLVSASSIEKEFKAKKIKKMEKSSLIGEIFAKRAKEKILIRFILTEVRTNIMEELKILQTLLEKMD